MTPAPRQEFTNTGSDLGAPTDMEASATKLRKVATELDAQAEAMLKTRLNGQGKLIERQQETNRVRVKSLRDTAINLRTLADTIDKAAGELRDKIFQVNTAGGVK